MPRSLSETDRKKNQFDKEERIHLLGIMRQYAPLLDSSASTLARKKIWTTIEDEFKKAGFTRKTSAQLKKYWQNYKYHCKKARALGKENKKRMDLDINDSPEWNRYQVFVENRPAPSYPDIPGILRPLPNRAQSLQIESRSRFTEIYDENGGLSQKSNGFIDLSQIKTEKNYDESTSNDYDGRGINPSIGVNPDEDNLDEKKEIFTSEDRLVSSSTSTADHKSRDRIVVSNARISNNSVTVSIVYPEDNEHAYKSAASRTPEAPSSSVSLSGKSVDEEKRNREDLSDFCDLAEHNRENFNKRDFDASIVECDSFEYAVNDLVREKRARDFSKKDGASICTEKQESNAIVGTRGSEIRSDPLGSRGYVFLTDYRNQLKHKLLLQQLETEEKRLKVKIAKMAIQEVQLRIKALNEDMRRTEELHRLHLARAASESVNFLDQ